MEDSITAGKKKFSSDINLRDILKRYPRLSNAKPTHHLKKYLPIIILLIATTCVAVPIGMLVDSKVGPLCMQRWIFVVSVGSALILPTAIATLLFKYKQLI